VKVINILIDSPGLSQQAIKLKFLQFEKVEALAGKYASRIGMNHNLLVD